jgi:hypothetical protein
VRSTASSSRRMRSLLWNLSYGLLVISRSFGRRIRPPNGQLEPRCGSTVGSKLRLG